MKHLTFTEAQSYLKENLNLDVKLSYLYRMSSLGHITFFPVGRHKVCTEADLLAFVENQRARAQHKADQAGKQPTARGGEAYKPRAIDPDIRQLVTGKP